MSRPREGAVEAGLASVVTPCYNGARYIGETIESVLAQTYPRWEMIVVDDGSTDGSGGVVAPYAEADGRIRYVRQENAGSAAARNNGIRRARGQYIALLDADDVWSPRFLERQIAFMRERGAVCVACSYDHIDSESRPILRTTVAKDVITLRDMRVMNRIGCLTGLYDCSRHGKVYLREELRSIRDDYAYWYEIVALEGVAYGNREPLARYRVLGDSTTGKKGRLVRHQYGFYRDYLHEGRLEALVNLVRWGVAGVMKFH